MADEHEREAADVAELAALFERTHPEDVVWETPPGELWDRIASSIEGEAPANVVPLARRRRTWWAVGAVATAAAVIVAVTVAVVARDDSDDVVVAAVELERLGDSGAGRAELLDRDGSYQVRLETEDLDADDGYLELWLLDPTATRLVSLGPLRVRRAVRRAERGRPGRVPGRRRVRRTGGRGPDPLRSERAAGPAGAVASQAAQEASR